MPPEAAQPAHFPSSVLPCVRLRKGHNVYVYCSTVREWQAPAAGATLAVFLTLWCWLVYVSVDAGTSDLPYNDLFRFSPRVDMSKGPIKELWAERKGPGDKEAKVIHYAKQNFTSFISLAAYARYQASIAALPPLPFAKMNGRPAPAITGKRPGW